MATVKLAQVPETSGLHRYMKPGDFVDCYEVPSDLRLRAAAEIIIQYPAWVRMLMLLRRVVTTPFGLVNDATGPSDRLGMFPIESETDEEILAGFDDKHLNFRISIMAKDGMVYFATWVHPHNRGGTLYLNAVMPFHILICRNALRRVAAH